MLADSLSDRLISSQAVFTGDAGVLMTETRDLGQRVELFSMDPHCHDISIALYRKDSGGVARYLVHSYSRRQGVPERLQFVARAIELLAGARQAAGTLSFPCHAPHQTAIRRAFLASCKLPSTTVPEARLLAAVDKRSGRNVTVVPCGGGEYQVTADGPDEGRQARIEAVVAGLRKLGELGSPAGAPDRITFPCGHPHDELVGLLLVPALNVRAILREEEMTLAKGVLVAPSAQK